MIHPNGAIRGVAVKTEYLKVLGPAASHDLFFFLRTISTKTHLLFRRNLEKFDDWIGSSSPPMETTIRNLLEVCKMGDASLPPCQVDSAIKHSAPAGVKVEVPAERSGGSIGGHGSGFPPDRAEQIFGVSGRLRGHEYPSIGVGLTNCKRIVERYQGRIWAEPGLGQLSASRSRRFRHQAFLPEKAGTLHQKDN